MKKILLIISLSLISLLTYSQGKTPPEWPAASSIGSNDLFLLWQSGALKNLEYLYLGAVLNDTADVLRAELPPLWIGDINDTANVLRTEIAAAVTADTAWTFLGNYVFLKHIGDSVGIGDETPTEKLEVVGKIKATAAIFNNGYDNILIGDAVGDNLTSSADDNVFIGTESGENATSGDRNVSLGYRSGRNMTIGNDNVMLGNTAGHGLTEGASNVFIGKNSGQTIATGDNNVCVGISSGIYSSSSSELNTFVGAAAGYDADINNGVFVGALAGYNYDVAGGVAVGYAALEDATSSTGSTGTGYKVYTNVTTSDYHTGYGYEVGDAITTGSAGSSLYGYQSGSAMTAADGTAGFGYQALLSLTTGDYNSVFGYSAGDALTTHTRNSFFGYQSGTASTGNYNSFFGHQSGKAFTSGGYNTGIGDGVLNTATTQNRNTAIGYQAGGGSTGESCIYIGYQAGNANTADSALFIDILSTGSPLIWGSFITDSVIINGDFRVTGYAGGATAWTDESDRRLKKNINPIENPLQKVLNLEGVQFEWIDEREPGQRIGLVAQDVEKVLPEVVRSGETYGLQYGPMIALLIEAIKEQQIEIQELKSQMILLKKKYVKYK